MHTRSMNEKKQRSDRDDLIWSVLVAALLIGLLVFRAVSDLIHLFSTPGAVTVDAPIPAQEITAQIGGGAAAIVSEGALVVNGVNTVSVVSLVLAIVLTAVAFIAASALALTACLRLLRGHLFDRTNVRLLFWLSMSLLAAWLCNDAFQVMGLNGVFAALDGEFTGQAAIAFSDVGTLIAAIGVGVLVIIFRRGAALECETEGLV